MATLAALVRSLFLAISRLAAPLPLRLADALAVDSKPKPLLSESDDVLDAADVTFLSSFFLSSFLRSRSIASWSASSELSPRTADDATDATTAASAPADASSLNLN